MYRDFVWRIIMKLKTGKERVLCISDLQVPFEHKDALDFVSAVGDAINYTKVVCIGDEVDSFSLSRYDPDPDGPGAGPELEQAVKHLQPWYKKFPEVLVCTSNHTQRVYKKAFKAGIPENIYVKLMSGLMLQMAGYGKIHLR